MHICTISHSYLPHYGGAEIGIHDVLKFLKNKTSYRFTVITTHPNARTLDNETIDGIEINRYRRTKLWAKWYAPIIDAFKHVNRLLDSLQPDVLIISYILPLGLAAWYYAKRHNIPVIFVLGGSDIYDPTLTPDLLLQKWMKYCFHRTSTIIGFSEWAKNYLIQYYSVNPKSVEAIPFGIDIAKFNPNLDHYLIRKRYSIEPETILLFALQRLDIRKGINILIDAIYELVQLNCDAPFHLIIGGKGAEKEAVEQQIKSLGLDSYITLAGFISEEEKSLYYSACDIFLLHSYHEGLGIVLQEAGAVGKPSISTYAGGTTDIISEDENGLLVPPGDAIAFANAIAKLINTPKLREIMGNNARSIAENRFSIENISNQYLRIIHQAKPPR